MPAGRVAVEHGAVVPPAFEPVPRFFIANRMRLYVETMESVVVEVDAGGRVRYREPGAAVPDTDGAWTAPSLQERRAIIHAARQEMDSLAELLELLDP